ncbi:MAG: GAF domain-containing protein, partial [Chloroflexi bacterium]|nr:GAF domain-containing protein [Chloroflexota bacterium]
MTQNGLQLDPTLRRRVRHLEQILRVSQTLNTTRDLAPLLQLITATAAQVTDCDASSILLLDPRTGQLRFEAAYGAKSEALGPLVVPMEGSVAGWVAQHGQALTLLDVRNDPRHFRAVDSAIDFTTQSLLAVPLMIRERCLGALEVLNKRASDAFGEEDRYVLCVLASQAAVAIENARLMEGLHKAHEELTKLDKLKSDFIAVASHELRTPLALILGYASFLKDSLTGVNREQADVVY